MHQYNNIFISYLHEPQHVSGDTQAIIRSLKLHWQPLVFHACKVVHTVPDNVHRPHVQQPSAYEKPEATSAVLGS